ncbi:MAG: response regulator [Planctomycetota bacterium]|nr:response regulator [Planctomycetota bacterium]
MLVQSQPTAPAGPSLVTTPLIQGVDDEEAICALFERIGQLCGFDVISHGTAASFLDAYEDARPGCIVLDLMLPDRSGLEVLQEVAERGGQLPVVFVSGMACVSEAVQALKLGSIDFIEKPFDIRQIADVLHRAIEMDVDRRSRSEERDVFRRRFETLSPREREVMELVVKGAANKEVAARLGLSHKTVEVHRANVMRKTQSNSLAELVRLHVAADDPPA